jgi:carboxyl-terminal processing protease
MSAREQKIVVTILLICLPLASFLGGYFTNDVVRFLRTQPASAEASSFTSTTPAENNGDELALFWEAWHLIEQNYIGNIPDSKQFTYALIRGAMASLNDPYTILLEPVAREEEVISLRGNFGGIGAYIQRNEAGEAFLLPIPGNPADAAGILEGDILLAVDGEPVTAEMPVEQIVEKVRGEKGTTVTLTVRHPEETASVDITIERGDILVPSVLARLVPDQPTIGYIQLTRFSGESANEMEKAIADLQEQGATSLILDLRGNGGGLVDSAVNIADQFIDTGVLLHQESRQDGERTFEATAGTLVGDMPVVVLIDGGTASASEILAGALQDYERATLLGTTTFGKGSVQLVYDLSDGSSIHVTSARWFTPDKNQIDQVGLTPDVIVEPSAEAQAAGRDEMLEKATELLLSK